MHTAVRQQFIAFSKQFEGRMATMYLDTHAPPLVTVGVGNLIDPVAEAVKLPFCWKGPNQPHYATALEIEAEWNHVKGRVDLAHSPASIWNSVTSLFLDDEGIDALVLRRLDANDLILEKRFGHQSWPADGQLGLHSMAWAMGAGFAFPLFEQSCRKGDFVSAAAQCRMADAGNAGLTPRNRANYRLFMNAAQVVKNTGGVLRPEVLYYPRAL
jgi:GH24 family phage-related lysozyme (muramidase)